LTLLTINPVVSLHKWNKKDDLTTWLSVKYTLRFGCFRGRFRWIWTQKVKN